jgi:hypothetical protein
LISAGALFGGNQFFGGAPSLVDHPAVRMTSRGVSGVVFAGNSVTGSWARLAEGIDDDENLYTQLQTTGIGGVPFRNSGIYGYLDIPAPRFAPSAVECDFGARDKYGRLYARRDPDTQKMQLWAVLGESRILVAEEGRAVVMEEKSPDFSPCP